MTDGKKFNWGKTLANLSEATQKLMEKYVCKQCNVRNYSHWNVCRDCNIFLCDSCIKRNHSPVLHHEVTRYMAFSDFGCPDHIQICNYFCFDCTRLRCETCKENECRHHKLTKDIGIKEVILYVV